MASWLLHYPIDDYMFEGDAYNDLLYPTPPSSVPVTTDRLPPPAIMIPSPHPPILPTRHVEVESGQPKYPNFMRFSSPNKDRTPESGPSTVVASNEMPPIEALESSALLVSDKPTPVSAAYIGCGGVGASIAGMEIETCELSLTSSSPGSSVQPSPLKPPPPTDNLKRRGRDTDDLECHSEKDVEFEHPDAKKQSHGSTSMKRSRAAEVHNLSERRRRDRISEKMNALQELIPRCNKYDKASTLDEAIKYLKSLQMQVQRMSMGFNMVPMICPGIQQYMQPIAMGMGMNHVMVPYPAILQGSSLRNPTPTHLGPYFPVSGFNIQPVTATCPGMSQAANMSAPMMSSFPLNDQNQPQVLNFVDPFQQYPGLHQTQLLLPQQNQRDMGLTATKPNNNKDPINPEHRKTG